MAEDKQKIVTVRIPESLHKTARMKLAEDDASFQGVLVELLRQWASGQSENQEFLSALKSGAKGLTPVESLDSTSTPNVDWSLKSQLDGEPIEPEFLRYVLKLARIFRSKDPDAWPAVKQNIICFYRLIGGVRIDERAISSAFGIHVERGETGSNPGNPGTNQTTQENVRPPRKRSTA